MMCASGGDTDGGKKHTDFVKCGSFRMFWAGYTFSLTVFFFHLLVSLQLNDGYLFHVSNPLNIEPTLCHMQFQLLAAKHKLWEPNHPSLPTGSKQGCTSMPLQTPKHMLTQTLGIKETKISTLHSSINIGTFGTWAIKTFFLKTLLNFLWWCWTVRKTFPDILQLSSCDSWNFF